MSIAVCATSVSKVFHVRGKRGAGDHRAVDAVSFTLQAGTCLGIVGESGSGKTTLARMIVGLETPTSGSIEVCGQDRAPLGRSASARRAWARKVQMVFQDPYTSLDRRQSGADCLREVLSLHFTLTAQDIRGRIAELAEQVGLTSAQMASRPSQLSGGQRQRLAIARSLAVEPELLVLDEPVSSLDVSVQAQVLNCLADIRDALGVSYLFVSHDLGVIRQIADEVIVMRLGKVVERGAAGAVLDAPAHEYTRLLLESVPGPGWKPPTPKNVRGSQAASAA
jgi:ABC-type glutathione transport system ATPase component